MGLPYNYGENFTILISTVFDRQTEKQMDGRAIAYIALSIYAIAH